MEMMNVSDCLQWTITKVSTRNGFVYIWKDGYDGSIEIVVQKLFDDLK